MATRKIDEHASRDTCSDVNTRFFGAALSQGKLKPGLSSFEVEIETKDRKRSFLIGSFLTSADNQRNLERKRIIGLYNFVLPCFRSLKTFKCSMTQTRWFNRFQVNSTRSRAFQSSIGNCGVSLRPRRLRL